MLIIGHRGVVVGAQENTVEAMRLGVDTGVDMLEFDVQLTRDKIPIVLHDSTLLRTHRKPTIVRWSTHERVQRATENGYKITTLKEVLDLFFGVIVLNLEIKNRNTADVIAHFIEENYITCDADWSNILFSSYKISELVTLRRINKNAELSLLHYRNPFRFMIHHKRLNFTAVGFHKSYMHSLSIEVARELGIFIYVYTVNNPELVVSLQSRGVEGVVTDDPKKLLH